MCARYKYNNIRQLLSRNFNGYNTYSYTSFADGSSHDNDRWCACKQVHSTYVRAFTFDTKTENIRSVCLPSAYSPVLRAAAAASMPNKTFYSERHQQKAEAEKYAGATRYAAREQNIESFLIYFHCLSSLCRFGFFSRVWHFCHFFSFGCMWLSDARYQLMLWFGDEIKLISLETCNGIFWNSHKL